jgi:PTH1 family peptidyl-tRNA hydrolase
MITHLVAGLGNDEHRYRGTPHNIGFAAMDALAERWGVDWGSEKGICWMAVRGDTRLMKPRGYMNLSGNAVRWAVDYWKIPAASVIVVCDDFALPWGRLRLRRQGSAGGHNGLKSVIGCLGTDVFPRLRVGVGPVPPGWDSKDFVLHPAPADRFHELAELASLAVEACLTEGLEAAMNRFNSAVV